MKDKIADVTIEIDDILWIIVETKLDVVDLNKEEKFGNMLFKIESCGFK